MSLEMISFENNGNLFKYRAAGVCLHNGHVLLTTAESADYHFLPGGKVEFCEDSETTLKREMYEEICCDVEVERLLWVVENFFEFNEENHHDISFIYQITPQHSAILKPSWTLETADTGVGISFRWFHLGNLEMANLKPYFLRESPGRLPETSEHLVIRE